VPRGWPASLVDGPVGLRPWRLRDGAAWVESRLANEEWLAPWEGRPATAAVATWAEWHTLAAYTAMLRRQRKQAKSGWSLPFAVTFEERLAGQVTVSNVVRGALDGASVGYWVDGRLAGRGIMPTVLALVVDHCFGPVGLHRVEANVRPENAASRRVVEKLGFRHEGIRERFLYIDGAWRDHVCYALTREDVAGSLLRTWHASR
jgi:ribosomal-protein-alanine N-acetyltransferase